MVTLENIHKNNKIVFITFLFIKVFKHLQSINKSNKIFMSNYKVLSFYLSFDSPTLK